MADRTTITTARARLHACRRPRGRPVCQPRAGVRTATAPERTQTMDGASPHTAMAKSLLTGARLPQAEPAQKLGDADCVLAGDASQGARKRHRAERIVRRDRLTVLTAFLCRDPHVRAVPTHTLVTQYPISEAPTRAWRRGPLLQRESPQRPPVRATRTPASHAVALVAAVHLRSSTFRRSDRHGIDPCIGFHPSARRLKY